MKRKILWVQEAPYEANISILNRLSLVCELNVLFIGTPHVSAANLKNIKFPYKVLDGIGYGSSHKLRLLSIVREMRFVLRGSVDSIVCSGIGDLALISVILKLLRIHRAKVIFVTDMHRGTESNSYFRRILRKLLCRAAYRVISFSKKTSDFLKDFYNVDSKKIISLPLTGAISNEELVKYENKKNITLCDSITHEILIVGKFEQRKNHFIILELAKVLKTVRFQIIGTGPLLNKFKKMMFDKNIVNIDLVEPVDRQGILKKMASADLLMFPSKNDRYGFVVEEAALVGLPIIIGTNVGANHLVTQNYNGIIVSGDSAIDYEIGIVRMLSELDQFKLNAERHACKLRSLDVSSFYLKGLI